VSHARASCWPKKASAIDIVRRRSGRFPEDLLDLNTLPQRAHAGGRDLVLYDSRSSYEYLDERFPHPPLMPVDPDRAQFRLALYRIGATVHARAPDRSGAG